MKKALIVAALFSLCVPALAQESVDVPYLDDRLILPDSNTMPGIIFPNEMFKPTDGKIYCSGSGAAPVQDRVSGSEDLPDNCVLMFDPVVRHNFGDYRIIHMRPQVNKDPGNLDAPQTNE